MPTASVMEFFVYSTKKLNLTMVHRDGVLNVSRAEEIMKYIQYFVENVSKLCVKDVMTSELAKMK